jgi:choline dehydrogenase-like flavoprotein
MIGLNVPSATSIKNLRDTNEYGPDKPRAEVWGIPWHSSVPFPGLAYCFGGRSLYWGGWSPRPLPAELPPARWPAGVIADLTLPLTDGDPALFDQAAEQIGVTETNDFIFGPLHDALRDRLRLGIDAGSISDAVPLAQLPQHLSNVPVGQEDLFKLEAPLAVQARPPRSGFFPLNKFSTTPLLIKAARAAFSDSMGDDVKKRLMVVPRCHVRSLRFEAGRVTAVETNQGVVSVSADGAVVLALGTVESTRLAQVSFRGIPSYGQIGRNLMAHLRSNLTVRIPRSSLPGGLPTELQASALFLKGRHTHPDGTTGHFHLQITAAGLGSVAGNAEAELFQKVPDIDTFRAFLSANDTFVVIHLRAIGEMEPDNPASRITLDPELDEEGVPRAFVAISPSANDRALWDAMDSATDHCAAVFGNGTPFQVDVPGQGWVDATSASDVRNVRSHTSRRDGLGTTHHEAGTLRMGEQATSVTDLNARFHHVANVFGAGPAVLPSAGSPNPMLTGIALTRRLVRHLVPNPTAFAPTDGTPLFNGFSLANWRQVGGGAFIIVDGTIESVPGGDIGLLWCRTPMPANYELRLEWKRWDNAGNSGVFIRFPDPDSKGYSNPAYVAVHFGFEVQIDELGRPDGASFSRTGAIYGEPSQTRVEQAARPAGQWNEFVITTQGQEYVVQLNGSQISRFSNPNPGRGLASAPGQPSFVGLQSYPDANSRVAFRNLRFRAL